MHDQEVLFSRRAAMTDLQPGEPTQEMLYKIWQVHHRARLRASASEHHEAGTAPNSMTCDRGFSTQLRKRMQSMGAHLSMKTKFDMTGCRLQNRMCQKQYVRTYEKVA